MKRFIFTALLAGGVLAASSPAFAQNVEFAWAAGMGGTGYDEGHAIAVDASGNVYTTGVFQGTVDFDPSAGTASLTSAGSYDIFVQKLDASGNFVWAKRMGGANRDYGHSIAVDASGNVYTTGNFEDTADFDPDAIDTFNLTSAGGRDIFVSRLDSSGNFVWAKQIGGTGSDYGQGIAVDAWGNVYTTGKLRSTADFDPGAGVFNLAWRDGAAFVSKFNASGNFVWAKQMGGSLSNGEGIAVDGFGNVYTTGSFYHTADFDPGAGTANLTSAGHFDIFVSKLDPTGDFVWAKQMGGTRLERGQAIAVDASGNVYTTGYFFETADFDPGPGVAELHANPGSVDIFVSKLNVSGNFVWVKHAGGTGVDRDARITVDAWGNVYTTGSFQNTIDLDPGAGTFNLTSAGSTDIFVQKLDVLGNFVWVKQMGGTSFDYPRGIAVDALGNVYTTGAFRSTTDFDPGPGTSNLTSAGYRNIFVSKLSPASLEKLESGTAAGMGGTEHDVGHAIAVDASGNVYATGYFTGTADFDPGAGTFNIPGNAGNANIFVAKLNANHDLLWANHLGGTGFDYGTAIAVDALGNVYTTGTLYQNENTVLDTSDASAFLLNSLGGTQIFVQKLDASGNFVWVRAMGGTGPLSVWGVAVDASGNVYTTGNFEGTADFDPGAEIFNLTSGTFGEDIFVQKLDASGNFVWAKQMGGERDARSFSIAVDESGNVFTTGYFYGPETDFDPSADTFNLTTGNAPNIFVQKLDTSGNFVWAKQLGGPNYCVGHAIAVDASGNVYTTGGFVGPGDFDPGAGTFNLTLGGGFVSKLDGAGNFVWAKQMGGGGGMGIAVDASGNVYTTGSFWGTGDFDPGPGTVDLTAVQFADIFVSKIDYSGNFLWANSMGGLGIEESMGIALAPSGDVYTTGYFGYFYGTADFDPGAGEFNLTSGGPGSRGIFVSKLFKDITPPVPTVDELVTNDRTPELSGTIDDPSAVIHVTVTGSYPTQTHPATNNGATWTLADNTLSAIHPGVREVTVTAWDSSGNAGTDATYDELTILGEVAGDVVSNLDQEETNSGARLELTAPAGSNYQWKKDGVNLTDSPPRVTGTSSQTLVIEPLEASDSGAYTVEYQATSTTSTTKQSGGLLETDPFDVAVDLFDFPEDAFSTALPAATVPVVMLLGVLLSLTGAWGIRRRRTAD